MSRRAGVDFELFEHWTLDYGQDMLVVRPNEGAPWAIHFPFYSRSERDRTGIVRKAWPSEVAERSCGEIPDFIVPFCRRDSLAGQPLFERPHPNTFVCTEDLLASILFTLSRCEECDSQERDDHGRFPAAASIASKNGFLRRPIVDEYGLAFQQVLRIVMPSWQPEPPELRVKLTHDIDELGIPFSFRSAVGHVLRRVAPVSAIRDFLSLASPAEPAYLHMVREICMLSEEQKLQSALYWQASSPGPFETGYDLRDSKIARVIRWAKDRGVEMGVHPGYNTFLCREKLSEEVALCRQVLRNHAIGGRQHYLRWSPQTWSDWESCDLAYDSSVGFAEEIGFRAGTCIPYLPWLWDLDRPANLLEIPLLVMDVTLVMYMRMDREQAVHVAKELRKRCEAVGGVFTLLWHNSSLARPFREYYDPILNLFAGTRNYDWQKDALRLRQEARKLRECRVIRIQA